MARLRAVCFCSLLLPTATFGQVLLNEICADNDGTVRSPNGATTDYVELYNAGSSAVNLSTWSITDDPTVPNKFVFPSGTSIASKKFLVVWLDSSGTAGGITCTNFSLKNTGEEVALFQGATRKDYVSFGVQSRHFTLSRMPDGKGWSLGKPSGGDSNTPLPDGFGTPIALRLNEWLATNSVGADFDWLEIYNPKTNGPVALGNLVISDQTSAVSTPALITNSFIDSDGFVMFTCDSGTKPNHLGFKLSSTSGETLTIYKADRTTIIDRITFGPQTRDVSMGRLPDGGASIVYFYGTNYLTPGDRNAYITLTNIIINETLTHTDPPLEDAIELYNPADVPLDISGWWLSNSEEEPQKFRIPPNSVIPAKDFMVFYEQNQLTGASATPGFNRSGSGDSPDFTLNSAHGDAIALCQALADGSLTGYRASKEFDASENGVSFGRYVKSDGGTDFVPMDSRTFGSDTPATVTQFREGKGKLNSSPRVGPLVISEILFFPPPLVTDTSTNDNTLDEYVELTSVTNNILPLYHPDYPTNTWRLSGGISFSFPQGKTLAANTSLLLVNFDPSTNAAQLAAFKTKYSVADAVSIYGPYGGKLNNGSDTVVLEKPDAVQLPPHPDAGFVPFVLVEKVKYELGNGWPTNVAGTGSSIQRLTLAAYGNDQTNWAGALPTAGKPNTKPPPAQVILLQPKVENSHFQFMFQSDAGHDYAVEFVTDLRQTGWLSVTNLSGNGDVIKVVDPDPVSSTRYYRVTAH